MRIPEASREVLKGWQANGLKFNVRGIAVRGVDIKFTDIGKNIYTISEQPIPEGMSWETIKGMWQQGLRLDVDANFNGVWRKLAEDTKWSGFSKGHLRIPFQPIPEKLLEVPPEVSGTEYARAEPHAAERALWKAQREAGTNEVWQVLSGDGVADIRVDIEPNWHPDFIYRVKPMKLTAKIIRREFYPRMAQPACLVQNWEFAGTREEYRAECEKYGYVVISEIKEVKPKAVKYYFALYKSKQGDIRAVTSQNKAWIEALPDIRGYTIIGDIEEREIEV